MHSMSEATQEIEYDDAPQLPTTRTFFGHPWGLANLFGVEMWERFSFYGMQGIVLFYMYYAVTDGGLGIDKTLAASIVGAYGGSVYVACIIAAFISDKILGPERTLFFAAFIVMVGHIALAFIPGVAGLAVGFILIAIGSGGVKTCSQVLLGMLYSRRDPRRDGGFSIYYMGINIGAIGGPLITTYLWHTWGFHAGFGIAAVGMFFGLAQYVYSRKSSFGTIGSQVPNPLPGNQRLAVGLGFLMVVAVFVALVATGIIKVDWLSNIVTGVAFVAAVVLWCQMYFSSLVSPKEKSRLLGFIPLFISGVLFFAIFDQQYTVLAIYSDFRLDREVFGATVPPSLIQAINPIFIVLLAGVFSAMWSRLGERQWSTPVKFGVANIIIGISLFFFIPFAGGAANSTPLVAIVWILFMFTIAELLLSPVGNSVTTKVSPVAFPSRMMAIWQMAVAMGVALAGSLANYYNPEDAGVERSFFLNLGIVSIVLGVALLALARWVVRKFIDVR